MHDPFRLIEQSPPRFTAEEAQAICRDRYGIDATASPLVSERDQNFILRPATGAALVLKIASALEDPQVTDFQVRALQHVAGKGVPVPEIVPAKNGTTRIRIDKGGQTHVARVVTYLAGRPLEEPRLNPALCGDFGRKLATLDLALADFSHPGEMPVLLWDMQRALQLRRLLVHVADDATRSLLAATLDEFEVRAAPKFAALRWQVIHNDANPGNVLTSADDKTVAGIIDFGDMLRSPLVVELAVAAAYLRVSSGDPLRLIAAFVAGYQDVVSLSAAECQLLPTLIRTRLATTVLILAWRKSMRGGDDAYLQAAGSAEETALGFLQCLARFPASRFEAALSAKTA